MPAPTALDAAALVEDDFLASLQADDLVYFCCNVGDADAQVVLMPVDHTGNRRVIVIDAGVTEKVPALLDALADAGLGSSPTPPRARTPSRWSSPHTRTTTTSTDSASCSTGSAPGRQSSGSRVSSTQRRRTTG